MNIFRIFFVSTFLIPILVVVVTSDESGIRLRKPRSIVITEDGTRTERRHTPVNITDKNCPSLGCTGNLTTNEYNGKGSLATSKSLGTEKSTGITSDFSSLSSKFHHEKPLKLDIKQLKNSTRTDLVNYNDYIAANNFIDLGTGRSMISYAILASYALFFTWRFIIVFILYYSIRNYWRYLKTTYGFGEDYVEYYVKLGEDNRHPFHNYGGGGWNPTFGISLKSKVEELGKKGWTKSRPYPGWQGWPGEGSSGWSGWNRMEAHEHGHNPGWAPAYHSGWPARPKKKAKKAKYKYGWGTSSEEVVHLGWKEAKKATYKYGKKAHKYALRPSKFSYMYDKRGNIILGGKAEGYAWRRRRNV